jgi:hypothetical protein
MEDEGAAPPRPPVRQSTMPWDPNEERPKGGGRRPEQPPMAFDDRNQATDSESYHTLQAEQRSDCVAPALVKSYQWGGTGSTQDEMTMATTEARSTSSSEDSPARTSQSPGGGAGSRATGRASSSSSPAQPMTLFGPEDSSSLRTFPDFFPATTDATSPSYSRRWPTSGFTTSPGEHWTADTSEFPSDGAASSSLADVLVAECAPRFSLSPRACAGILRRAERRGRELPPQLGEALRRRAAPHLAELAAMNPVLREAELERDEALAEEEASEELLDSEQPAKSQSPSPAREATPPSPAGGSKTTTTSSRWEEPTLLDEPSLF